MLRPRRAPSAQQAAQPVSVATEESDSDEETLWFDAEEGVGEWFAAIAAEIGEGGSVHGLCLRGERFDCGSKRGYLEATMALALERADVGGDLRKFILGRVTEKMAAE